MSEVKKESIGAWKRTTPKGEVINFTINGQRYNMWVNKFKEKPAHRDFKIYEDNYNTENKGTTILKEEFKPLSDDDLEF
mgnify:CR=1 FL=1